MKISKGTLAALIIAAVIIIDQAIKIWVKTHFYLGEELMVTSWFRLLFIENNGMAFGMELGSKLFLTVFRLILAGALIWYIWRIRHAVRASRGYVVCLSLIVAGALGNIIDCVCYGQIFNDPLPPAVAQLFPPDGGYASLFHGKVVDMFYFPLFSFVWPDWMPWVGGTVFEFFKPVFNFADAAISVGIIALILFFHKNIASPEALSEPEVAAEETKDDDN
ncbi:MAG: lipoprotein signal peptidase [Paramuribaculum sp.]|nr:lipoprotein signal peptidase [Paramuribaculum sp.]